MNIILINLSLKIVKSTKSMKNAYTYVVHKLTHSNRVKDQWIPKHTFNIINGAHFLLIGNISCNQRTQITFTGMLK